ncbi:MAG TPA: hypothetical protein VMA32_12745 [Streptosporangiaceae bacterium]|nr:hypothetical protein [Streptosporangiaceae bacterium]
MVSMKCPDTGPGRGGPGVPVHLHACPECELPAEITERFWLDSTDGPVLHVCVTCVDGHYFRMPADRLAAIVLPDQALDTPAPPVGFTRLPGQLGTVWSVVPDRVADDGAEVRSAGAVSEAADAVRGLTRGAEATASLA